MSSPSAAGDALPSPDERRSEHSQIPQPALSAVAAGEPVVDLPPMVELMEPEDLELPASKTVDPSSPRRHFLDLGPPTTAPEPAVDVATLDPATPVVPGPKPGEQVVAPVEAVASAVVPRPPSTRRFAAARALVPADRRWWLAILVGIIIAIGALVAVAKISRIGPFKPVQQYPTAAAPSDPAQRLAYFQSGAKAGDANAELQLAILYAKGEGVAQDYATSATWFRAAANQGVARAQYDLGVMYERGRGVPVDLTQSADWYLKAAKGGYPLAQYNLAVCYTKGQGIRQDQTEAALWYHRAASQGVVQAMINLGMMYEKGDGVAVSPVDAYAWYLAAGRRDNQPSAHRAEEIFNGLPRLDQVRADALASDVAASIHDPEPERDAATTGSSDAKPAAPTH
jgi:hypothetical protein